MILIIYCHEDIGIAVRVKYKSSQHPRLYRSSLEASIIHFSVQSDDVS